MSSIGCTARISAQLIARDDFAFVAVEADWLDATRIDDYVLGENGVRRSSSQRSRYPLHEPHRDGSGLSVFNGFLHVLNLM
jgi:hypothetical protein